MANEQASPLDQDEEGQETVPQDEAALPARLDMAAQWKVFLTSVTGAGVIDFLAHGGWLGMVAGVGMSAILARQSPELYEAVKDMLLIGFLEQISRREEGKRSLLDRAMGWYPTEGQTAGSDEEDRDEDEPDGERESRGGDGVSLPIAPPFRRMSYLIAPNRLVLCWTVNGPLHGTIEDLLSMVIIGKPGRGKTTALIYYVAILLKAGAEVHVWDPHGSLSEHEAQPAH
jgi:hypothetical protein